MTIEEAIHGMIDGFHSKAENDPKLREELAGITKKVNLDLGSEKYSFILEDARIHSLSDGLFDEADVTILSDPETIQGLISRRIKPMKALALRKLRVKGDIQDLMRFRKLF